MVKFIKNHRHLLMKEVLTFFFLELMKIQVFSVGRKSGGFYRKLCKKA